MNSEVHVVTGLLATAALATLVEAAPVGGVVFIAVVLLFVLIAVTKGEQLPLWVKVLMTGSFYYLGYSACLGGRTMEPRLNADAVGMALLVFVLIAAGPSLSMLRLWRPRVAFLLLIGIFPVSFFTAATVASIEEHLFIRKYRDTGVGPTARWTVSNHWLSYDHSTQRLDGSD